MGKSGRTVDFFRYHDLTQRLAAFDEHGDHLAGDRDELEIVDGEPRYEPGEEEVFRAAGAIRLHGSRSTRVSADPSIGLVLEGGGVIVVTTERLIVMCARGGSQLGSISEGRVHTFVFPWDLVDTIVMPARKSVGDRIAGARTINFFSGATIVYLDLTPLRKSEVRGHVEDVDEERLLKMFVRAGARNRLLVSPASDHARLQQLVQGSLRIEDDELIGQLTPDHAPEDLPAHLVGRIRLALDARQAAAAALLLS